MKHIPNAITLINLFTGCIAVASAFSGDAYTAAWLILFCAFLDFLDGTAARVLKAGSELGKQLDSLADLISFGMAPATILFTYLRTSPDAGHYQQILSSHLPYFAFLITVFSALRLARFNIDTRQTNSFIGLPTPANALFFAFIPLVLTISPSQGLIYASLVDFTASTPAMLITALLLSWLLIAPVNMFSMKFKSLKIRDNIVRYIFIISIVALFLFLGWESMTLIIPAYILTSFIVWIIRGPLAN